MDKRILLAVLPSALLLVAGCNSSTPQATAQQVKDFKGGPMPPEVRKQFEASQRANADKIAKSLQGKAGGQ